jgi:predicted MPP superfamily phosphohydrolase
MNPVFILIIGVTFLIYGGLNYYIGLRGWQTLFSYIPFLNSHVYWLIFWLLAIAFVFARFSRKFIPKGLYEGLTVIGAYWLAFMYYFVLLIAVFDLLYLMNDRLGVIPKETIKIWTPAMGLIVLGLVISIVGYGVWNARHPRVKHYDITIDKHAGSLRQLHVVMVSDIHLGTIIHNDYLTKMVAMVNQLKPDLILFAGDVFDENVETVNKQQMTYNFRKLNAQYGTYAVLGNHEYIGGNAEEAINYLTAAGVKVLRDSVLEIDNSFYLVGRDDRSGVHFNGGERADLKTLLQRTDRSFPIIVIDHQPQHLPEAEEQGVDLQLSGHTHAGQLFPIRLITGRIFENDWGYMCKGNFQLVVSSGYGTWGPPIRVGNTPEIVDITMTFRQ